MFSNQTKITIRAGIFICLGMGNKQDEPERKQTVQLEPCWVIIPSGEPLSGLLLQREECTGKGEKQGHCP